jgi:APA family basic amino acid/polyamine antiporter
VLAVIAVRPGSGHVVEGPSAGLFGIPRAAALIFFTFAGYARIATLGEEVRDPQRTLPRAVIAALTIVLVLAAATAVTLLYSLGPTALAASTSPLADAAGPGWQLVVRVVAGIACLGSLLSVLAGLSRTSFAMARDGELPARLARVSARTATPVIAETVVALVGIAAILLLPPAALVGVSACAVLGYYGVAHLSALAMARRRATRAPMTALLGLLGCLLLAFSTPWPAIVGVAAAVLVALAVRALIRTARR